MDIVRITKAFNFEMGHALMNYAGKCANIHGHSYHLEVILTGNIENDIQSPRRGMVMDFGDLKRIVQQEIIDVYDHALMLNKDDNRAKKLSAEQNLILVPFQPTCECILLSIVAKLKPKLAQTGKLYAVILHETATSKAEWCASDNN